VNREARSRLLHDVGKYVARTARNLPDGPLDRELIDMVARDLYELKPGRRASQIFDELAEPDARLQEIRPFLTAIDKLETRVRAYEEAAVRGAAALAIEVERRLRDFAGDAA
jgi:hypothetical protein